MRPFYLYKTHRGIFYVQFFNAFTGKRGSPRSTFQRNYTDAFNVACNWLQKGIQTREGRKPVETVAVVQSFVTLLSKGQLRKSDLEQIAQSLAAKGYGATTVLPVETKPVPVTSKRLLIPFLENFWTYDDSPYVKDKLIHKQRIGKRHCYDSLNRVAYWKEFFGEKKFLEDTTTEDLKAFESYLYDKKLSTGTLNHILIVGKTAFKWAVATKKISENPCTGLTQYGKEIKLRDILTPEEAKKVFEVKWNDERARVGSLIAMTCGLRMGEVLALRMCDITKKRIYVRHSWSTLDGLKTPKNGKVRAVPLLPNVRKAIVQLVKKNPYKWNPERFLFYGTLEDKPIVENVLIEGFKDALRKADISEDMRKTRNIVFHSWRHYYAKEIADRVEERKAQLALGHLDAAMTRHYADHKTDADLNELETAVVDAFKWCS